MRLDWQCTVAIDNVEIHNCLQKEVMEYCSQSEDQSI